MKLSFWGATGGEVTGSCYLLETERTKVVVDMGMFQGIGAEERNLVEMGFEPKSIDKVILTHAHLDHCGRLPLLASEYKNEILTTIPTIDLMDLVLNDAANLMEDEGRYRGLAPLYTQFEVAKMLGCVKGVEYEKWEKVGEDVEAKFLDAGHILGAASVQMQVRGKNGARKTVVFSGDIGNEPSPLVGLIDEPREANIVVMESTYGDRLHEKRGGEIDKIADLSNEVERNQGTLLIPAFSLERTQELLFIYDGLKKAGKVSNNLKVYLDAPMGIRATAIYEKYERYFNEKLRQIFKKDDPFDFPGLLIVNHRDQSKKIDNDRGAKVIIAGSGMMSGGRIVHHAARWLSDTKAILLFTGFQAKGTRGRHIVDGDKRLVIEGRLVDIHARIERVDSMSGHADQRQLLDWLAQIGGVEKVILVHGENQARETLAGKIKERYGYEVIMPDLYQALVI